MLGRIEEFPLATKLGRIIASELVAANEQPIVRLARALDAHRELWMSGKFSARSAMKATR